MDVWTDEMATRAMMDELLGMLDLVPVKLGKTTEVWLKGHLLGEVGGVPMRDDLVKLICGTRPREGAEMQSRPTGESELRDRCAGGSEGGEGGADESAA